MACDHFLDLWVRRGVRAEEELPQHWDQGPIPAGQLVATSRPEMSLLTRRNASRPSELAFYLGHTLRPVPLALVRVAGACWAVAKHVRRWSRWRHRNQERNATATSSDNDSKITKCGSRWLYRPRDHDPGMRGRRRKPCAGERLDGRSRHARPDACVAWMSAVKLAVTWYAKQGRNKTTLMRWHENPGQPLRPRVGVVQSGVGHSR